VGVEELSCSGVMKVASLKLLVEPAGAVCEDRDTSQYQGKDKVFGTLRKNPLG